MRPLPRSGPYSVVITNAQGTVISSNAMLTVVVPPTITTQPLSQTVTQGLNATFTEIGALLGRDHQRAGHGDQLQCDVDRGGPAHHHYPAPQPDRYPGTECDLY